MATTHGIKTPFLYVLGLIAVWTIYRLSGLIVPQEVDEFIIKPLVWLVPVFWLVKREGRGLNSLGITTQNLWPGLYLAIFLGLIFALEAFFVSYLKHGNFDFAANLGDGPVLYFLFISLATAVTEELVFRGYLFNRIWNYFKNEILANLITSMLWVIIHVPATFAVLGYSFNDAFSYWFLAFLYSIGAGFIFARTRNIFAAIILYVLWEAPLILFR